MDLCIMNEIYGIICFLSASLIVELIYFCMNNVSVYLMCFLLGTIIV